MNIKHGIYECLQGVLYQRVTVGGVESILS